MNLKIEISREYRKIFRRDGTNHLEMAECTYLDVIGNLGDYRSRVAVCAPPLGRCYLVARQKSAKTFRRRTFGRQESVTDGSEHGANRLWANLL